MAKVSVIVPVFNVAQYLDKCIQSLTHQTLSDIEIICVDDCSTDNGYEILKKYAAQDERITLLQTKKNSGQSTARNIGLDAAKADYIMFCDSDDWYEPTMCQEMLDLITKNKADLGICSVNVVYETDTNLKNCDRRFQLPDGIFASNDAKIKKLHNGIPLRIIRHNIIKKNNIRFPIGLRYEDIYFSKVYNLYAKKIVTTSHKLYNYRRRADSTVNKTYTGNSRNSIDYVLVAIQYFEYLKKHNFYAKEYQDFWSDIFISCAQNALMFTKNRIYSQELDTILSEFVSKNYIFGTTTPHTDYIISLILSGLFMRRKKYLFGLIQTYHETNKTEFCIWKISVFKIKYINSQIKYYLFGICVYKRNK